MAESINTEHRRLAILRHLESAPEFTSNASILTDVLNGVGVPTTDDQMRAALSWLEEQELITLTDHGSVLVAAATARGGEVARGRAQHPGVKRPRAR